MATQKPKSVPKPNRAPKRKLKDDPEQSAKFLEAAKLLEADETGEEFEKALDVIAPKKSEKKKGSDS